MREDDAREPHAQEQEGSRLRHGPGLGLGPPPKLPRIGHRHADIPPIRLERQSTIAC